MDEERELAVIVRRRAAVREVVQPIVVLTIGIVDDFRERGRGGRLKIDLLVLDRKSTRLNSSHVSESRMPSSA